MSTAPTLFVPRDWRDGHATGEITEMPDQYQLATTYSHSGQTWHVLHRTDRDNWTVVVDNAAFQSEWVSL
jgi:hypothetical protein